MGLFRPVAGQLYLLTAWYIIKRNIKNETEIGREVMDWVKLFFPHKPRLISEYSRSAVGKMTRLCYRQLRNTYCLSLGEQVFVFSAMSRPALNPTSFLAKAFRTFYGGKAASAWSWPTHFYLLPNLVIIWSCNSTPTCALYVHYPHEFSKGHPPEQTSLHSPWFVLHGKRPELARLH
jgi:hypothetical protein